MCVSQLLNFGSSYVDRELKKIKKWLDANRLALNITKTNCVIFHSPSKMIDQFIRIKLGSKSIDRANFVKYLGILFDSTLSWKPHVSERSKKLARTSGIFFKIRHYVSNETLRLLHYSLFYSFISYGISVIHCINYKRKLLRLSHLTTSTLIQLHCSIIFFYSKYKRFIH